MNSKIKPIWFEGDWYEKGGEAQNTLSGKCCTLSAAELSIYDYIMGCQILLEKFGGLSPNHSSSSQKAKSWLKKHNPEAYNMLFDTDK